MPTTPKLALPYPAPTDAPDVPYHMQQLAETVEANVPGASTAKAGKRLHWQLYPQTMCDALGKITYTHGAGFTPSVAIAVSAAPSSLFPMVWGVDNVTSTSFQVRYCLANGDTNASNQNCPAIYVLLGE